MLVLYLIHINAFRGSKSIQRILVLKKVVLGVFTGFRACVGTLVNGYRTQEFDGLFV